MKEKEKMKSTYKHYGIAIFAVLILAIAMFAYISVFAPRSASSTTGTASAGGVHYTVTPVGVTRNSEGQMTVEAEVVRKDSYRWRNVTVQNILAHPPNFGPLTMLGFPCK